ncbi:hypothetical protein JK364_53765 [Streptomyces sp. 110]|uniref:Uncharacterized protein n=1 Tax=Streptomyces endocoffeicus TaxID=2898945 RepID=A0ABS1Q8Q1_9ACTN|nr:hypothetical protein [Streptomyces endocoffeicus]MBL1121036.1 hypothetical protein [Streptomyces endocoffeicus]
MHIRRSSGHSDRVGRRRAALAEVVALALGAAGCSGGSSGGSDSVQLTYRFWGACQRTAVGA